MASATPRPSAGASGAAAAGVAVSTRHAALPAIARLHPRVYQPRVSGAIAAPTVPHYAASFKWSGKKYTYTSVGTNPRTSTAATHVPVIFIPVKMVVSGGYSYPTGAVGKTENSAIFKTAAKTNNTQYGDATLRSSYWKYVKAHGGKWHVLLAKPSTKAQITIKVPSNQGGMASAGGNPVLVVNDNYLGSVFNKLAGAKSAKSLVIFLTYDMVGCSDFTNLNTCGTGGFHSAIANGAGTHTYSWASWLDVFGPTFGDIGPMTHEIAEWLNDPFVNDKVPAWSVPSEPQYGCSNYFEVGDPLVGKVFAINGLHYQDEADFSWFARQKPSVGFNGWYTYLNNFKTYSPHC